jgi:hypothetical protein
MRHQAVQIGVAMRRRLDRHIFPCRAKLICRDLGKAGPDALAGFDLRNCHRHAAIHADLQERAEHCLAIGAPQRASLTFRPGKERNHQPDTRSAANQQGAAIDRGKLHPA